MKIFQRRQVFQSAIRRLVGSLLCASCISPIWAQQRVDPHFTFFRVYCVVPLGGTGTNGDPVRPEYSQLLTGTASTAVVDGSPSALREILGFYREVSDDGKWALMEIVARNRAALEPILNDRRPGVWAVEKGSVPRSEIEAVFRKFKRNIDFIRFGVSIR